MSNKKDIEIELINLKERHKYIQGCLIHMMWKHAYPEYHAPLDELQDIFEGEFEIEPAFRLESKEKDASDAKEIIALMIMKDGKWVNVPAFHERVVRATRVVSQEEVQAAQE